MFHLLDGTETMVEMMEKDGALSYMEEEGYRAVEIPYKGSELSMLVILPEAGQFGELETKLSEGLLQDVMTKLTRTHLRLFMPKFSFSSAFSVKKALTELGVRRLFTEDADLSGMSEERRLFVTEAVHKAFIQVDEQGTQAGAATGVSVARALVIEVKVDRSFIFLIRDGKTGAILFLGRVTNPVG